MSNGKPPINKTCTILSIALIYRNTSFEKLNFTHSEQHFLERAEKVITDNIHNKKFSVSEFAKCMYMGRGNLYRLTKRLTGHSPTKIILKSRLSFGKFLLENSNLRVNEVAEKVGYNDYAYFSRIFKKYYNCPPSHMRVGHFTIFSSIKI